MKPGRLEQLVAFLGQLGLDPTAPGGPGVGAGSLAPVEEALSHSSAGLAINHEQLEFLGDAVLRLAASVYLEEHHSSLSVGRRSALRAQLVSDRWLADLGERCGIESIVHLGAMAQGDQAGQATVRAECTEALIGAIYSAWGGSQGGLVPVLQWLSPHWQQSAAELVADPDRHNWKSGLQEWSQGQGLGLPNYRCEERSQGHADPQRFWCEVTIPGQPAHQGWGPSRRAAEQEAARSALEALRPARGS
jgi:ribonuclease-3